MADDGAFPRDICTLLECASCQGQLFRVSWNWEPSDRLGWHEGPGAWMLECVACHMCWLLQRDGIPNQEMIRGSDIELPPPGGTQLDT